MKKKNITINEAEKIISDFNKLSKNLSPHKDHDHDNETKANTEKKVVKSSSSNKKKIKKVSKK